MSRKNRRLTRILGVSTIILAVLIANIPTISFAEMTEQNIIVENLSSYQEGTITATTYVGWGNPSKLIIEDYPVMDDYVYDSGFYSRQYDNYLAIKVRAVDDSGNDVSANGRITIQLPSSWDIDSFFVTAEPNNKFNPARVDCFSTENGVVTAKVGWSSGRKVILAESKADSDVFGVENGVLKCFIKPLNSSTVTVPEGVNEISLSIGQNMGYTWADGPYAQYWENNTIVIPKSVTKIGLNEKDPSTGKAYYWGEASEIYTLSFLFSNIEVDKANPNYASYHGALYNKDLTELICCSDDGSESLPSLPESLQSIGEYAFFSGKAYFRNIENITIPDGVYSIGESAFTFITFKNFVIPESVQSIGTNCIEFTDVLPNSYDNQVVTIYGRNTIFEENAIEIRYNDFSGRAIVRGYSGSTAEEYVSKYNAEHPDKKIIFESLDNPAPSNSTVITDDRRSDKTNSTAITATVSNGTGEYKLIVKDSDGTAIKNLIILSDGMVLMPYNISLVNDSGNSVTDFGSCIITLPIPSSMNVSNGMVQAMSIKGDGTLEKFNTEIIDVYGVKCARFTTTHFSEYALVYTPYADNVGGNDGDDDNGGTGNGNDTGNDNSEIHNNTNNKVDTGNVTPSTNVTNTSPNKNTQIGLTVNNLNDMPKTGVEDDIKTIIVVLLFLFGCIEIVLSISIKKKVKVKVIR